VLYILKILACKETNLNYFAILNQPIDKKNDIEFNGKYIHFEQYYSLNYWKPYFDEKNQIRMFILGKPTIGIDESRISLNYWLKNIYKMI